MQTCPSSSSRSGRDSGSLRIEDISRKLVRGADGIYVAGDAKPVSYAADGHSGCLQVEDSSFWFRHRNQCIANVVGNHPFQGPLLDIGGGNGYVAQRLVREGHDVVLLEPGPIGAHNARKLRGLEHVACASLADAGFRAGSFGAIGMFDVIEHIEHDRDFLSSIVPLLAPGGRLYLTVPCYGWLWSQADVRAGHFRRHTRDSLAALLDGLFEIDYLSHFFRLLIAPQFLARALPHRLGFEREKTMRSTQAEHGSGNGVAVRILSRLLESEARTIAADGRIGIGASCILAARRL